MGQEGQVTLKSGVAVSQSKQVGLFSENDWFDGGMGEVGLADCPAMSLLFSNVNKLSWAIN